MENNLSQHRTVDVIVSWPRNNDYPFWRHMIRENRHRFNKVIVVFTETHEGEDYREFVFEAMKDDSILFIHSPIPFDDDWRNVAVNEVLRNSSSEWVWFTEQDFFPQEDFWEYIGTSLTDPSIGFVETVIGQRSHPCSLFARREALDATRKNFGIIPNRGDHFCMLTDDLHSLEWDYDQLPPDRYIHLAGLSHNWRLLSNGEQPNHQVEAFKDYLRSCLKSSVALHPKWESIATSFLAQQSL